MMVAAETPGSRARIMEKALELFATHGYRGLSMREIAVAVGFTKAALYYHFRDKEDLFAAIVEDYITELGALVTDARLGTHSCRAAVEQVVRTIMGQPAEKRAIVRMVSQEIGHLREPRQAELLQYYQRMFLGQLQQLLAEGAVRGELRSVDPAVATWALLGILHPFFTPAQAGSAARVPAPTIVDALLRIYFEGLAVGADDHGVPH